MADNNLERIVPQLLAQGLMALRSAGRGPALVNREYEVIAGQRGSTIDVPIPATIAVQEVQPANVPPQTEGVEPGIVSIPLDQWYEAPFYLTDKEEKEVMEGHLPMTAGSAIKSLAEYVNGWLYETMYKEIYGFYGTPGTTPFDQTNKTKAATQVRRILHEQLCPATDRRMLLDPDAEANALELDALRDASYTGDAVAIIQGELPTRIGFSWFMDQQMPYHTAGTGGASIAVDFAAGYDAGVNTIHVDGLTATTGTLKKGDILEFAGHEGTYVVVEDVVADGSGDANVEINPPLRAAVEDDEAITLKDSHQINLAFHPNCFAFVNRPLDRPPQGLGSIADVIVDPITGLALRLEVRREHKRTRYSYDMLWGGRVIRPELGCRLAG